MEIVLKFYNTANLSCEQKVTTRVTVGSVYKIRFNATIISESKEEVAALLEYFDYSRFTIWTYSHHVQSFPRYVFWENSALLLAFCCGLLVFQLFGTYQKENSFYPFTKCLLNIFRLSLGQSLRINPQRWSMKWALITWVIFQMHASVVYQGVLMSYDKFTNFHTNDYLLIPNKCLTKYQRMFETGHFKVTQYKQVTRTLKAANQLNFLLWVICTGWFTSLLSFLSELTVHHLHWVVGFCYKAKTKVVKRGNNRFNQPSPMYQYIN